METLVVSIADNKVDEKRDWNTRTIDFENGAKQYQQTWTEPEITISFTTSGSEAYINKILDFFNARKGMFEAFLCDVYKTKQPLVYRFGSSSLSPEWIWAEGKRIGGTLDISLIKVKGQGK